MDAAWAFSGVLGLALALVIWNGRRTRRELTAARTELSARSREKTESDQALREVRAALDEHAIVAITDPQGRITYVNEKFCAISGYSREELMRQDHRIINSQHHPKSFFKELWGTIGRGEVWRGEIRNRAKDGSLYWVDTTIVPFVGPDGKPRQYVAIRADITTLKNVEENLAVSLRDVGEFKAALDQHAIVAITDPHGRITYVNDKFCAISQYPREELLGQDHRIINSGHHPSEFFADLWKTIGNGRVWHGEVKNRAKDGSYYWVDTTIVPFLRDDGKPRQYVAIRADITRIKEAETTLTRQAEDLQRSNRDLEQFAYVASHDLREPLRAVGGCLQVLERKYEPQLDDRGRELINHAVDGAARMQKLIGDLLLFSRVGTRGETFAPVLLDDAVDGALKNLQALREEASAKIIRHQLPTVNGDVGQLTQLFQNLIGNALKFRREEDPEVEIGAEYRREGWCVFVRDNGIGIDPQYFQRIFDIFQRLHTRREYPGTGIGLALCKKIMERHGGSISVESEPDRGTTFFCSFAFSPSPLLARSPES